LENILLDQVTNAALDESKRVRALLSKRDGVLVERQPNPPAGAYLENYSRCLLNRQIDIFDDTVLLLENGRIPSACVISRAMIETFAFAKQLANSISIILDSKSGTESVNTCIDLTLKYTNSSRFKETEQKKVSKSIFALNDYQFTTQARVRMENSLATSEHVMNALRSLYKEEMEHTGRNESQYELVYDALSEWVHPSQTSVFHNNVPETHGIPTSVGVTQLYDVACLQCVRALHFLTNSEKIHCNIVGLANEITQRANSPKADAITLVQPDPIRRIPPRVS
jgi:Family of unknown function (DUF5677)